MPADRPTATLLIVGDEILSGKVVDRNSPFLLRRLRQLGIEVLGVHVVPDELDTVARFVREAHERSDWVFTSGGVGPTHDDITMAAVAAGLDQPLELHPELVKLVEQLGMPKTEPILQMLRVPRGARLHWNDENRFPQVEADGVWIFPGVPGLLKSKFNAIAPLLGGQPIVASAIHTTERESELAPKLTAIIERWPGLAIGSYPAMKPEGWTVTLILEHLDASSLDAATEALVTALRPDRILSVDSRFEPPGEGDDPS